VSREATAFAATAFSELAPVAGSHTTPVPAQQPHTLLTLTPPHALPPLPVAPPLTLRLSSCLSVDPCTLFFAAFPGFRASARAISPTALATHLHTPYMLCQMVFILSPPPHSSPSNAPRHRFATHSQSPTVSVSLSTFTLRGRFYAFFAAPQQ
jgi:hypothetical protein